MHLFHIIIINAFISYYYNKCTYSIFLLEMHLFHIVTKITSNQNWVLNHDFLQVSQWRISTQLRSSVTSIILKMLVHLESEFGSEIIILNRICECCDRDAGEGNEISNYEFQIIYHYLLSHL